MKKIPKLLTCIYLIAFFFTSSSALAIMEGFSTEELTAASDLVIEGQVEKTEAQWSKDGKSIFTSASVIIHSFIKGGPAQKKIKVEYAGGEIGDIGMKVSDQDPSLLTQGEKVLLFLKAAKSKKDGDAYTIIGKGQGKYRIDENGIARKGGFTIAGSKEMIDNNIPVDQLIKKIKKAKK